ncbi:hypothetical protein BAE44_0007769 [Dichanthelium oligosanthes]|uniref:HMA domain-containing protein n=1 Tax=Dichanthelium oligosanthes TaxID=888268 RepID=A0A1E5W1E5_9POAL|nr:hypothetical protein BAE44_0007769 [Dichanthelium oligosanthes]
MGAEHSTAKPRKEDMGKEAKREEVKMPKEAAADKKQEEQALALSPEEIEMRVYMHYNCKRCIRKVKKILTCFDGVEDVIVDTNAHKVVVKGKKVAADPAKVVELVQKKTGHKVDHVLPIPTPPEENKEEEKEEPELPKLEEKNEPPVITVVLKVDIHGKVCAYGIMMLILKMKGVQSVEADLEASEVTVKGIFEEAKLAKYVYKCTGKHPAIIKSELVTPLDSTSDDNKAKEGGKEEEDGGDTGGEERDVGTIAATNFDMYYPWFTFPGGYFPPPPGYVYQPAYQPPSYMPYAPSSYMA